MSCAFFFLSISENLHLVSPSSPLHLPFKFSPSHLPFIFSPSHLPCISSPSPLQNLSVSPSNSLHFLPTFSPSSLHLLSISSPLHLLSISPSKSPYLSPLISPSSSLHLIFSALLLTSHPTSPPLHLPFIFSPSPHLSSSRLPFIFSSPNLLWSPLHILFISISSPLPFSHLILSSSPRPAACWLVTRCATKGNLCFWKRMTITQLVI